MAVAFFLAANFSRWSGDFWLSTIELSCSRARERWTGMSGERRAEAEVRSKYEGDQDSIEVRNGVLLAFERVLERLSLMLTEA